MDKKTLNSDQTLTAICSYLGLLVLIPLLVVKKRDEFIRFHLNQGITLLIVWIIAAVALSIISIIPFIGWFIAIFGWMLMLGLFIVAIIALVKALSGEQWKIPYMDFKIVDIK